jgi:hypothetical protein
VLSGLWGLRPDYDQPMGQAWEKSEVRVSPESRSQTLLSRCLIEQLGEWEALLLWVLRWGLWPSEENPALVRQLRAAAGESRPLVEAPGHLFAASESAEAEGFVRLALLFGWDALAIPRPPRAIAGLSHNQTAVVYCPSAGITGVVRSALAEVGSAEG